ncbi:hypothetical protein FOZ62_024171, partial [Perkinsus olseni]
DGQWKLIDLGGLMLDGSVISPANGGSITFTPVYASPELGRPMAAYLSGISDPDDDKQIIRVAKSMDVWALGILISKIVLGKEPTAELWKNCMSVAESGSSGEADFYHSIIRYFRPRVSVGKRLAEVDPDLADLILQMMTVDEKARATIGVLRGHRYCAKHGVYASTHPRRSSRHNRGAAAPFPNERTFFSTFRSFYANSASLRSKM